MSGTATTETSGPARTAPERPRPGSDPGRVGSGQAGGTPRRCGSPVPAPVPAPTGPDGHGLGL